MTDTDDDAGHAHGHGEDGTDDHSHDGHSHGREHGDHGDDHDHSHDHHATDLETVGYAVVTVSSSRRLAADTAGDAIVTAVEAVDDEVVVRELVADEFDGVQSRVAGLADRADVDCVVTTGGTGVTPDDVTVEAVRDLFDTELPGFGELFRELSRDEIGTRVIATRATAGIVGGVPVFCLPGSENAARLGAEELVTGEAAHLAGLARRE